MSATMQDRARQKPSAHLEALRDALIRRSLPPRVAKVAEFGLRRPEEIAFGTVAGLARRVRVSPSTVLELTRRLGHRRFAELQHTFREHLRAEAPGRGVHHLPSSPDAIDASPPGRDGMSSNERALRAFRDRVDHHQIESALRILASAETIFLMGTQGGFAIVAQMNLVLEELGIRSMLVASLVGNEADIIGFAARQDAVLITQCSPLDGICLEHARSLVARAIPLVVITGDPHEAFAGMADSAFCVGAISHGGVRSMPAALPLVMALACGIARLRAD